MVEERAVNHCHLFILDTKEFESLTVSAQLSLHAKAQVHSNLSGAPLLSTRMFFVQTFFRPMTSGWGIFVFSGLESNRFLECNVEASMSSDLPSWELECGASGTVSWSNQEKKAF